MRYVPRETVKYIEEKITEYECRYDICVLLWFVRKSFMRGLERKSSDLDIVFVFTDVCHKKMIFERADRRVEIQCWNLEDILDIIITNRERAFKDRAFRIYYKEDFFKHYILDYYNGFYCGLGSALAGDRNGFLDRCEKNLWRIYEPLVPAWMFYLELKEQLGNLKEGYFLSLNEFLNAVWCGLEGIHLMEGGRPWEADIKQLSSAYFDNRDYELVCCMVSYFKNTVQKQSNFLNSGKVNRILNELSDRLKIKIDTYKRKDADIKKDIAEIKEYADVVRKYEGDKSV